MHSKINRKNVVLSTVFNLDTLSFAEFANRWALIEAASEQTGNTTSEQFVIHLNEAQLTINKPTDCQFICYRYRIR